MRSMLSVYIAIQLVPSDCSMVDALHISGGAVYDRGGRSARAVSLREPKTFVMSG
jgi:hypothetical protein